MSEALFQVRGLEKNYRMGKRTIPVIRGLDLEIKQGEILGLLGKSGAGKSTLLHILGLLDSPSDGSIQFRGQETSRLSGQERARLRNQEIGFVFQFYHLIPELTALQNAVLPQMIGSSILGWGARAKKERARAEEILTRFGLKDRLDHRPAELSGGERQRVAIARALVPEPRVLLCDEPTGNLDSKTGQEILDILEEVHQQEKTTLVLVTHDESIAGRCQRIIRLKDGKVD